MFVASGRPKKQQQQPGPDDEPQLDMDDVMYVTDELEGEEGLQVGGLTAPVGVVRGVLAHIPAGMEGGRDCRFVYYMCLSTSLQGF
jgi:hypothetical protein